LEGLDYWRLCDELSVVQAALLIVGQDPAMSQHNVLELDPSDRAPGFDAALAALKHAINAKGMAAIVRRQSREQGWDEYPGAEEEIRTDETGRQIIYTVNPDWNLTTVKVDDLRGWLRSRGLSTGFFFLQKSEGPDYLDPRHSRYAPKLAAAVRAWISVTEPGGKHPKQALTKWLREHAVEFGLTDDEGKPNETGIEEIAKVANWQPVGGAPRTLG
jgi:hypothetical protein